jgi:3-oxoadipate enol-lactonase
MPPGSRPRPSLHTLRATPDISGLHRAEQGKRAPDRDETAQQNYYKGTVIRSWSRHAGLFDLCCRGHPGTTRGGHYAARLVGVKLAYDDTGSGHCVVLLHGHPFDRTLWEPQVAALTDSFRVLVPDLRGFGRSPVTPGCVTMRELAADIEELLDDLGIESAAPVGLSMGGLVTMELAAARPQRYWAIGLVATTVEPPTPQDRVTRLERADAVERDGMGVLVDYMHAGLYGPACPPAIRGRVDAMMAATSPAGAAAALRGRADRPDYRPLLARLDIPAFVCGGSADPWSDNAVMAEIAACLKHPEVVVIEDVAHLPNLEAERDFNETLRAFLLSHAPA